MTDSLGRTAVACLVASLTVPCVNALADAPDWQEDFGTARCTLKASGRNDYFILEPGYQMLLEGPGTRLQVTVLDETRSIGTVTTRAVEEREWKKGQLFEVAKNYYAFCEETKDILYFGEDVDFYERGKVTRHDGSWLAETGNRPGLVMPGAPRLNMRYFREMAPGTAMDRAEIVSLNETCITPAGSFAHCMKIRETSALEPHFKEYKWYAPGIGLVVDDTVRLVRYGPSASPTP
jgi:hypothetical protein